MGNRQRSEAERPYDTSLEQNMSMYDKLPYQRNEDMCNASTVALNSGNLLKYYRCNTKEETREIQTKDDQFDDIVSKHLIEQDKHYHEIHEHYPTLFGPLHDDEDAIPDEEYDEEDDYED